MHSCIQKHKDCLRCEPDIDLKSFSPSLSVLKNSSSLYIYLKNYVDLIG